MIVMDTKDLFLPVNIQDLVVSLVDSYDLVLNLLENFSIYF